MAQQIENTYGLKSGNKNPLVSVVTIGELRAFAQLRQWGKLRLRQAEELLGKCEVVSIVDEKILDAYADLNTYSIRAGRPLGDNDL